MEKFQIDVPVLLIFFNRPGCFQKVFEQVRMAKPSKLFLYQDGAREGNEKDQLGVARCREIASQIDWECDVKTLFQENNFGCDPSEFIAQKWAFSFVDRCIILEDDDVPSQSFFPFCKELLEKYKDDNRINMICGMNNLETWDSPYSYLFTETGSIWGWATWKRVVDEWDGTYSLLKDDYNLNLLKRYFNQQDVDTERRVLTWKNNADTHIEHYETILGINQFVNHRLNIVPTKNMIINVGNTPEGSTHSASGIEEIPRGLRKIYTMKSHEIEFPLKHPPYVINDVAFQHRLMRLMGIGHPLVKLYRHAETLVLMTRHSGIKATVNKLKRKMVR